MIARQGEKEHERNREALAELHPAVIGNRLPPDIRNQREHSKPR